MGFVLGWLFVRQMCDLMDFDRPAWPKKKKKEIERKEKKEKRKKEPKTKNNITTSWQT